MRIPVQNRRRRTWHRIAMAAVALTLLCFVVSWIRDYARDSVATEVADMGGTSTGTFWGDLHLLRETAWPKQAAAQGQDVALPTLTFDVGFKHVKKLAQKRAEALKSGYLVQADDDYVPATVRVRDGDRTYAAASKIRLKGDFVDHLQGEKWSFRVKTKGTDHVLGMRVFSVQHPRTRGYAHEPVFLDYVRRQGVLAPRYVFVRVVFNGRDKGIMALEEHFSKELLESQDRRESVIVRFDESLKWRTVQLMGHTVDFSAAYPFVKPFQQAKIAGDPVKQAQLDAAVSLLRGLISKKLRPSQVFDAEIMARFLAACEVFGAEHSLAWNNLRFYYNPVTALLEPIAFDANLQDYAFLYIATALVSVFRLGDEMSSDWLGDPEIRRPFLRELHRLRTEFPSKLEWLQKREATLHAVLHREFPLIGDIPFLNYNFRVTRLGRVNDQNYKTLPLRPPAYPALAHAFLAPTPTGHQLELYNLVPYELEILKITSDRALAKGSRTTPFALPPTLDLDPPKPTVCQIPGNPKTLPKVILTARIKGYPESQKDIPAILYAATADRPVAPTADWSKVATSHPFVVDHGDHARIGPGDFAVASALILPPRKNLVVAPGTTLRFAKNAFLMVRGKLEMKGTKDQPIRLVPRLQGWPGVAVFGDATWHHVHVRKTTGLKQGRWEPTGSVMVHGGRVEMRQCSFVNNRAEDAVNLFRASFQLEDVTVADTTSDAIDMDFCQGTILRGAIRNVRGDGVDVSGTKLSVDGTAFDTVRDKAISIGERSQAEIRNVNIHSCGTGLASKDDSDSSIRDSKMTDIGHVGVMAYIKKPEYGGARVTATNIEIRGGEHEYIAQIGSSIQVNSASITPIEVDVEKLYNTIMLKHLKDDNGNAPDK